LPEFVLFEENILGLYLVHWTQINNSLIRTQAKFLPLFRGVPTIFIPLLKDFQDTGMKCSELGINLIGCKGRCDQIRDIVDIDALEKGGVCRTL